MEGGYFFYSNSFGFFPIGLYNIDVSKQKKLN